MTYFDIFEYGSFAILAVAMVAFVFRCRFRVRVQAIWTMVLLTCFAKFFIYHHLGGHPFTPNMPEHVMWLWNWGYSGACLLTLFSVLTVAFRVPARAWILPILAWGIAAWGVYNGICLPEVHEVVLEYADLPPSLEGYRIVHISDTHVSAASRCWRTKALVDIANGLKGDLIAVTGDIVDGSVEDRMADTMPLKNLRAPDGVWYVTGNHEGYSQFDEWSKCYDRWGMRFLHNECVFPRPGLAICGFDDGYWPREHHFAAVTNGEFRVLLVHRPKLAAAAPAVGAQLALAGHTHGGVMPLMRNLVARYNAGFVRGVYDIGVAPHRTYLSVSSGTGQWAGFPVRLFNPSEINVYTLKGGK